MSLTVVFRSSAGAASITGAGGISSAEALGQPAVAAVVAAAAIGTTEALGQPTVSVAVQTAGIASAEALGQPGILATIATVSLNTAELFGQPVILASIDAASIDTAEVFGAPTLAALVELAGGIASDEAFGQPFVGEPAEIIDAGGIASAEALGAPTITEGAVFEEPQPTRYMGVLYAASLSDGPRLVKPPAAVIGAGGIESAEMFGLPALVLAPMHRRRSLREREWLERRAA